MTGQSKVTLQPLPTLDKVITDILETYMDEVGYGDFFDSYKTVAESHFSEIAFQLYSKMQKMNDKAMVENGRCPECGGKLIRKYLKQTKWEPGAEWVECEDCHDEIREVG